jgi:hypothetical protein
MTDHLAFVLLAFIGIVMVVVVGIDQANRFLGEVMDRYHAERTMGAHFAAVRRDAGLPDADEPMPPTWVNGGQDMATDPRPWTRASSTCSPGPRPRPSTGCSTPRRTQHEGP